MSKFNIYLWMSIYLLVVGCSRPEPLARITVSEVQGLDRALEYVSADIPLPSSEVYAGTLFATDTETETSVPVQISNSIINGNIKSLHIVFPVTIEANTSKIYHIDIQSQIRDSVSEIGALSADTFFIQNDTYKVLLSDADELRGGQISGIILKKFQDQVLKRDHIAMHWAPNFSKSDSENYFNLDNLSASSENELFDGKYQILKKRSGATDSVPEIDMMAEYTFYADLPYFDFESTMTMNADVELNLLRNDEMTMDSLFTHVVFQEKKGKPIHHELYGEDKSIFKGRPISDDVDFVAFYHKEMGYGLASIRLIYDNANIEGNASPVTKPYSKISESQNNGRYWNRVLSDTVQKFPKGSQYREKNAYLIFQVDKTSPEKEILYYQSRLKHPLTVIVE